VLAATLRPRCDVITTIHLLKAGQPLCGFSKEYPRDWPAGNAWQPFEWLTGGLAGEEGILTKEISRPTKCLACRGCVKRSVEFLMSHGWKWKEGENLETLLEKFGLQSNVVVGGEEE